MHNLRWREAIKPRRRCVAVSADVLRINQVLDLEFWEFLGQRNRIQRIARLPENRADFRLPFLEGLQVILAMIENDPAEGVINAVVDVVAGFAVTHCLADDARDGRGCSSYQETARLRQDLNIPREQPVDLGVNLSRQQAERFHVPVVWGRKTSANIQDLDLMAARLGLAHYRGRNVEGLHEVLEIGALAADVKTEAFDDQPQFECQLNQVHRLARVTAEF